jgi:hypothetical protein
MCRGSNLSNVLDLVVVKVFSEPQGSRSHVTMAEHPHVLVYK